MNDQQTANIADRFCFTSVRSLCTRDPILGQSDRKRGFPSQDSVFAVCRMVGLQPASVQYPQKGLGKIPYRVLRIIGGELHE